MRRGCISTTQRAEAARLDEALRRNLADLGFWR